MPAKIHMDNMMMTVAGPLVLAILVAIFNWINGKAHRNSIKESNNCENVSKVNEKTA